jgi:hypothetical protein
MAVSPNVGANQSIARRIRLMVKSSAPDLALPRSVFPARATVVVRQTLDA